MNYRTLIPRPSVLSTAHLVVPLGIFLLSLGLRLWCIDCQGLWYDEIASIEPAQRGIAAIFTDRFGWLLVQPPLHYLIVWLTLQPIDPTVTTLFVRLPSVLCGALTPLAVYGLGRELFGRAQGVIAALMVAISAVHVAQSQDVRPYTIVAFLTAFSVYALLLAERETSIRWWAVFVATTTANLYISYFTSVLVMPALAPYLLWLLYRLWFRPEGRGRFRRAFLSMLAIAVAFLPGAIDTWRSGLASGATNPPDLSLLSVDLLVHRVTGLLSYLTKVSTGGDFEIYAQWGFFTLFAVGLLAAIHKRMFKGVALCLLLLFVPMLPIALFSTTNTVFQRYAIFTMPFYFLLVANSLVYLWSCLYSRLSRAWALALRVVALVAAEAILTAALAALFVLFTPRLHSRFSYYPDYRGAAAYLASKAEPQDIIIFADEPGLGSTVMNFYWHGKAPAPAYDARDPRLFAQQPTGSIYWALSFFQFDPDFQGQVAAPEQGWLETAQFDRIVALKESGQGGVLQSTQKMMLRLQSVSREWQPVRTLLGSLDQAEGKLPEAAQAYRDAGDYYQWGREYLLSARGYAERADKDKAWRDALLFKFINPANPEVHEWLSQQLLNEGYTRESQAEAVIAKALRGQ